MRLAAYICLGLPIFLIFPFFSAAVDPYDPAQAARLIWPDQAALMLAPHQGDDGQPNLIRKAYHDFVWFLMNKIIHMTPRMLPIDPLELPTELNLAYPLPLTVATEETLRKRRFRGAALATDPGGFFNSPSVFSNLVRVEDLDFDDRNHMSGGSEQSQLNRGARGRTSRAVDASDSAANVEKQASDPRGMPSLTPAQLNELFVGSAVNGPFQIYGEPPKRPLDAPFIDFNLDGTHEESVHALRNALVEGSFVRRLAELTVADMLETALASPELAAVMNGDRNRSNERRRLSSRPQHPKTAAVYELQKLREAVNDLTGKLETLETIKGMLSTGTAATSLGSYLLRDPGERFRQPKRNTRGLF